MKKTMSSMAIAIALAIGIGGTAAASATSIYDTIPDPLPSSVPSLGYQASQTAEFGQQVSLDAEATADSVTVVMNSWACADGVVWTAGCGEVTAGNETYSHPVTVNIYEDNAGAVGSLIKTVTQDVDVPFRPAADPTCDVATKWRDAAGDCSYGYAFPVTFDLNGTALPESFIYSIVFDTAGDTPADSLNVGLKAADGSLGDIYWAGTIPGSETFQNDGYWGWDILASFDRAMTADDCMSGGFADHGFKNQGQCVASVMANWNAGK